MHGTFGGAQYPPSVLAVSAPWEFQPVPVLLALVALALFAQGFRRLRERAPEHAGWSRPPLFVLALACATLPLVSPLDTYADEYLLSAHMLEHVLIGDVAPALALLAVRGPLVFFLLPPPALRFFAGIAWLRRFLGFLLRPAVAFVVWVVTMAAWHVPAAYDYAVEHEWLHNLEHLTFAVAGLLVWAQLVDPARRRALTLGGRILYAWALFVVGMAATHVILLDSVAHYPHYADQPVRLLGLSPVSDQHWAAWIMTLEQVIAFGTLTLVLVWRIPIPEAEPVPPERRDVGGEAACYAHLLCPDCGIVLDGGPHRPGCASQAREPLEQ
jgi:cytochrome c oxidase assembly factor CtaG